MHGRPGVNGRGTATGWAVIAAGSICAGRRSRWLYLRRFRSLSWPTGSTAAQPAPGASLTAAWRPARSGGQGVCSVKPLSALRDYPRSRYSKITTGEVDPAETKVVEAEFELDDDDRALLPEGMKSASYVLWRNLDNSTGHRLVGVPAKTKYSDIEKDLLRLAAHVDGRYSPAEGAAESKPSDKLKATTAGWHAWNIIEGDKAKALSDWLEAALPLIDEDNEKEEARYDSLKAAISIGDARNAAVRALRERVPVFVLFSNYFRVRPLIHLKQLAARIANGTLDEERFDYGNVCLLNLLGFTAAELSEMGFI